MTQILIVDDNPLTSVGMRSIIETVPTLAVCGSVERGSSAVLEVAATRPHVAVLCVTPGVEDYLGDVAALSSLVPVLVVTTDETSVPAVVRHGAAGCLMYGDATPDRLVAALVALAAGQSYLSSHLLLAVVSEPESVIPSIDVVPLSPAGRIEKGLTHRECEVMDLVSTGMCNEEIAGRLFLSEKTVRNYLSHAYAVLGATSRTQAALAWRVAQEPTPRTSA